MFDGVWKGIYDIKIELEGYEVFIKNDVDFSSAASYNSDVYELKEIITLPMTCQYKKQANLQSDCSLGIKMRVYLKILKDIRIMLLILRAIWDGVISMEMKEELLVSVE